MSRELKFRAWDTGAKRWTSGAMPVLTGLSLELKPAHSGIIIERYTGLKDKNDKEIYIGDIVSEHQGDIIGEIVQNPSGEYRIAWLGIYGGDSVLYDHQSLCEVIGNIHENPELIGKEKE